jgi:hypothetical protein
LKRIKIPSTVTIIGGFAFCSCCQLEELELSEGIQTIRKSAFNNCESLKHISFPSTIRSIGATAFTKTKSLLTINLPDGMERIGSYAFFMGGLLTFRIPPLITTIPEGMVQRAESLFSVELSESVTYVASFALWDCYSLRNLAISPNTSSEDDENVFLHCQDLQQLFDSGEQITNALKHRFDNLPIHKMLYYQSYESMTVEQLNSATNMRSGQRRTLRSKLDPTGKQHDCLGMTPLHILACSTVQNLELYQVLVKKYPENLVVEDRWGALPLLYAVWGNAPSEIVQYLVGMYKSLYPEYELNWTKMVETLGLANVPKGFIQKLVDLQKEYFPKQSIDWNQVDEACASSTRVSEETFGNIVQLSVAKRVGAIGLKQWRDEIMGKVTKEAPDEEDDEILDKRREFLTKIQATIVYFETEYQNLKEATSIVELAFWKQKMNDHVLGEKKRRRKKTKIEDSHIREQCRISCGADIVIQHMLPYLVCPPAAPSSEDDSNSDHHSSSESDDESDSDISYLYDESDRDISYL